MSAFLWGMRMKDDWKIDASLLFRQGNTKREIARELGVPYSTVWDFLKNIQNVQESIHKSMQEVGDICGERLTQRAPVMTSNKVSIQESIHDPYVNTQEVVSIETDSSKQGPTIIVIPDTQCKLDQSLEYLRCIGEYIAEKRPDVIVHLGDHADMPSLSSYDKGKKSAEGKRVVRDIQAAISGMNVMLEPVKRAQEASEGLWKPRMVMCLGNHDGSRIKRHVEANPELDGLLSIDSLRYKDMGWEVVDFLNTIVVGGVTFVHYTSNPYTGKPLGGTAATILKEFGMSVIQGHKQGLQVATRTLHTGQQQWSIVAGACYAHNEDYRDAMANKHWRGLLLLENVCNGDFDLSLLSLEHIMERFS